jgi:hypothetical protein
MKRNPGQESPLKKVLVSALAGRAEKPTSQSVATESNTRNLTLVISNLLDDQSLRRPAFLSGIANKTAVRLGTAEPSRGIVET